MNSLARAALAVLPAAMLLFAPFIANRDRPHVAGMPFLLAWIIAWVLLTPFFLAFCERLRTRS